MHVIVRKVDTSRSEVRADLNRLQKSCLPCDEPCNTDEGTWWIAYYNDMAVGFGGVVRSAQWHGTGYMCRAGVMHIARGKGLQKKLIRARIRYARKVGWTHLVTDTTDNHPSANSLISCGFKMYDPRSPWAYKQSCYWIKKL